MIVLKDQNDTQLITQQGNYIRQELYDELEQKLEEQTKEYQKILATQQEDIDQLERNCDVFNEQMNDAVERATELQQEKNELIKWLKEEAETYRFRENYEELSITGACEMILERLGE